MVFSGIPFLYYFLPITLLIYFVSPRRAKNAVLLLASLVFYSWGGLYYTLLMVSAIIVGYISGRVIDQRRHTHASKVAMIFSVVYFLGVLGFFKYADFFIDNVNALTGLSIPFLRLALPIGISFYTFQILSYTIDVYRNKVPVQKNPFHLALYITMFPQLIAGPIVRYSDIHCELTDRTHSVAAVSYGIERFVIGLSKKVLIANLIGNLCETAKHAEDPSTLYVWLYAVAFMLQIYFDFSGYSDMAIGLGCAFGFRFPENFRYPYTARSVTDFWRRWHMTLGTWFRDYVYIPMGGNRVSKPRWILNIFGVWMLTGLWHGAAWNFVLWGLFFAVLLIFEKTPPGKALLRVPALSHIYVLLAVMISFILFDASSLPAAVSQIGALFSVGTAPAVSQEALYYLKSYAIPLAIGILGATPLPAVLFRRFQNTAVGHRLLPVVKPVVLIGLLLAATAFLVEDSFNPFLYFRF